MSRLAAVAVICLSLCSLCVADVPITADTGQWRMVVSAAGPDGVAYEDHALGHGWLSWQWAEAIREARRESGCVDLLGVLSRVMQRGASTVLPRGGSWRSWGSAPPQLVPKGEGRVRAVLIGVNGYDDPDVTPLKFAVADAYMLAGVLAGGLAAADDCTLLVAREGPDRPTRARVLRAVDDLAGSAGAEDTLVVCFAGQGGRLPSGDALLPIDTCVHRLGERSVPVDRIVERLSASKAHGVLVLLDCCSPAAAECR